MKRPELLSPAGTFKNLRYALAYGADAVYAGLPRYSLRVRNNDFRDLAAIKRGIDYCHERGKTFLLATNAIPHSAKLKTFLDDMAPIIELGPDALIMADPGLILLVREHFPDMAIHLSVQANTMNSQSVRFWQQQGVERVILSRELSLDQVEEIRQDCPDMELEVFVHGALCIAHSGRCLLSGYFNHRDANQGTCTNSCRWQYSVSDAISADALNEANACCSDDMERHPAADEVYYLQEEQSPGELMPIEEDEQGTYIMNSKDLRAVEHVARLVEIGVDCLKIEGRTKSHYYTARTTSVYRQAIDDAMAGRELNPAHLAELSALANRGYTDGFFQRHTPEAMQSYLESASQSAHQQFVGELEEAGEDGWTWVDVKNRFRVGDTMEFIAPGGSQRFELTELRNERGEAIQVAPGSGHRVQLKLPRNFDAMGLLTRVDSD
ncbi:MAG: tRNA 5-hydroxyuridine modification protein YegQ [Gammaproteobacteria bacterium]